MSVMHAFGRDTKFTPHIHALMTSGGSDANTLTKRVASDYPLSPFFKKHFKDHFLENMRKSWRDQQLDRVPPSLRFLFRREYQRKIIRRLLSIAWYVYSGERLSNAQFTVRYIGRYAKRPAIAESGSIGYDGTMVPFDFVDHKTEKLAYHTLPAQEFIGKRIRRIPDEHFRIIRYSGFYANRVRGELLPKVFTILKQEYEKAIHRLLTLGSWWRSQITRFTKLDPLICSACCIPLTLISVVYTTNTRRDTYG
ncbi:MAG: transposase [Acidobacteria bacterium]|nr:transposase [Acidobacteriota bacterium]